MNESSQSANRRCRACGAVLDSRRAGEVCVSCALEGAMEGELEVAQASVPSGSGGTPAASPNSGHPGPERSQTGMSGLQRFGDYELLEEIARGGMGVVFKALQSSLDRLVAIKMLLFGPLASAADVQRFRTEAAAAASLQHPNIVAIHEVGFRESQHFIAMDYVAGRSLAEIVRDGPLPARRAAGYVKTIAEAIQYAHQRGILHRDIKPSNVLIDADDQPKVSDFGLAKRLEKDSNLTLSGQVLGSPGYMAPEQGAAHRGLVSKRSDVYSLGAILYHLLTGRPPFVAPTVAETLQQVQNAEPVSPTILHPHLPRDLKTICLKCLEKEPSRRYTSAQELADELGRFLADKPILARPVGRPEKAWRWCRRKPAVATLSATSLLLLLAVVIGSPIALFHINKHRRGAEQSAGGLRLSLYAADINLAHEAVRMNNLGRASELLNRHRPEPELEDLRGWEWRYLWGRCQSDARFELCRLPQSDGVVSVALRPGTPWVAIGGQQNNGVEVWDLSTRRLVARPVSRGHFAHVAFSPDGNRLAFSTLSRLRVWDCVTQVIIAEAPIEVPVVSLAFSADGQAIAAYQEKKAVTRWRASNLEMLSSMPVPPGHAWLGTPFGVTSDLKTAVIVNGLDGFMVVDLESGKERWRTNTPPGWVNAMAISPDGTRLATSSGVADGTIEIWNMATGAELAQLKGHRAWVSALKFWPDGKSLASASADQTIRIWDLEQYKSIRTLRGHKLEIWSLALSSDAGTLVSGGKDGQVLVWDANSDPETRSSWTLPGRHWSWHFSTDSQVIHAVERAPGSPRRGWRWSGHEGHAVPDVVTNLGHLHRYQGPRFEPVEALEGIPVRDDFTFSRSGRLFAASTTNGVLQVWNLNDWVLAYEIPNGAKVFRPAAFSTDETRVWLLESGAGKDGASILSEWDLRTRQRHRFVNEVRDRLFTFHPDDWAVWRGPDGKLIFHDLRTGRASHPEVATGRLAALFGDPSASFGGDLLVLGHEVGALTVWDTASLRSGENPRRVATLGGILMSFSVTAFSRDSTRLLACSHGTEALKIWDTRAYHELLTLEGEGNYFSDLRLSADGRLLGALSDAGEIHLWSAPSWDEIAGRETAAKGTSGD